MRIEEALEGRDLGDELDRIHYMYVYDSQLLDFLKEQCWI